MIKRYLSVACVCGLLIGMAGITAENEVYQPKQEPQTEIGELTVMEQYEAALTQEADLHFWYDDAGYRTYFKKLAADFYQETGILTELTYVDTMDYAGTIYDATMKEDVYPDAFLLSGEELEKAHLYGLAGENLYAADYSDAVAKNAVTACMCHEKMFGYPLSFNVCLLAYNSQYFETAPESLQEIIDYAKENEPDENVQYLLEWDAYDPFFGFLFLSDSVVLNAGEVGVLEASYDAERLEQSLLFLEESLASFSLPLDTVTEESVIADVLNGTTLCAIVDSDSVIQLQESGYNIAEFPHLNEELNARSAALTDMILVNDYSQKKEAASAFAKYLTLDHYEEVWELTGHYPVQLQTTADETAQIAYQAYETAIPAPNTQDAGGFWIYIKGIITEIIKEQ